MNIHELLYIGVCLLVSASGETPDTKMNCEEIQDWLKKVDVDLAKVSQKLYYADWKRLEHTTQANADLKIEAELARTEYLKNISLVAEQQHVTCDADTNRKLKIITLLDTSPRNTIQNQNLAKIKAHMVRVTSSAKATHPTTKMTVTSSELRNILSTSNDLREMQWAWQEWRNLLGRPLKSLYSEYIKLSNIGAKENGFDDYGDSWRQIHYMTPNIDKVADQLYSELRPMYEQLFTYVRRKLIKYYGKRIDIKESGPVPVHLFGGIFAADWTSLMKKQIVIPFPNVSITNVTDELINKEYTVRKLVEMAENFFTSIGLFSMTKVFWEKSIFVKPNDNPNMSCMQSSWEFLDPTDFRLMMCAEVTHSWLIIFHYEMGHTEYSMAYKDQPTLYRAGANTAFHEAIGAAITLSVSSNEYLKKMNLTNDTGMPKDELQQRNINGLMLQALRDISSMPFAYIVDKMRWGMFDGSINAENYNKKWWEYRLEYQGVVPPVKRSKDDFDFGSIAHVAYDVSYLRYFLAGIIKYQFYKAMCDAAGHKGLLHQCDFSGSTTAGTKLKKMLEMGKSQSWPDAMEVMTGQRNINTAALVEYYKPLTDWLKEENKGKSTSWIPSGESVKSIIKKYVM